MIEDSIAMIPEMDTGTLYISVSRASNPSLTITPLAPTTANFIKRPFTELT